MLTRCNICLVLNNAADAMHCVCPSGVEEILVLVVHEQTSQQTTKAVHCKSAGNIYLNKSTLDSSVSHQMKCGFRFT